MMLAVLQARTSSRRLPGKVLEPIGGEPMLCRQIERVRRAANLDALVVATSTDPADDPVARLGESMALPVHRGSLDDVLDRVHGAALAHDADHVVRLTGDCPLSDPAVIDACIELHRAGGHDYTSNVHPPTWPDGLDVEVVTRDALEQAWCEASIPVEREHVTWFIHQRPGRFRIGNLVCDTNRSDLRWTVDEPEDLELVRAIHNELYDPADPVFGTDAILALLRQRPDLAAINSHHRRNTADE